MNSLITFLADYAIIAVFALLPYLWFTKRRSLAYRAATAAILAWLAGKFIKDFFYVPRPFPMLLMDGSFPSNHTAAAFAISVYVFLQIRRLGKLLIIVSLLIGLSRILEGAHFSIDILGGAALGSAVALVIDKYHSK